jgi:hypothetical protein
VEEETFSLAELAKVLTLAPVLLLLFVLTAQLLLLVCPCFRRDCLKGSSEDGSHSATIENVVLASLAADREVLPSQREAGRCWTIAPRALTVDFGLKLAIRSALDRNLLCFA